MSYSTGSFFVSVDSSDADTLSIETVQRRRGLIELLQRFDIPSNWTILDRRREELPRDAEITVGIPKTMSRYELIQHLRCMSAILLRDGAELNSVVADPHEARKQWDVLVRQGCAVVRPRSAVAIREPLAQILRGGLWVAPLSCSFVGGSRRSVRSLFSICQRRLVESTGYGQIFHLHVDIGNQRNSWAEESQALRALFETADEQRRKERLRCVRLSELPTILTRKPSKPMHSILRRTA